MSEKKIQINENDYDPVNRYIDDQSSLRRSRSFWGYAKSIALILIALGILAILIAYAFYLYKKKDYQVKVDQIRQEAFSNGSSKSQGTINQLQSKIKNFESNSKSNELTINSLKQKNKALETDYQNLQKDFSKSREEVSNLRLSMLENKEVKFYQKELQKIKEKASKENTALKDYVILFIDKPHTLPNGRKIVVKTRWYFKDTNQEKPDIKNCYVDFQTNDLRGLELGDKKSDFAYANYYSDRLKLNKSVFKEIKDKKCDI